MRMCDWSLDVCSSDFDVFCDRPDFAFGQRPGTIRRVGGEAGAQPFALRDVEQGEAFEEGDGLGIAAGLARAFLLGLGGEAVGINHIGAALALADRSEEHTSELQSLMRISYAVFCLKKKTQHNLMYKSQTEYRRISQQM